MDYQAVERLLIDDARLLARRDSPVIDEELEQERQQALELFFQWQDGIAEYQDLMPFVAIIQRKVNLNKDLLRWERKHLDK